MVRRPLAALALSLAVLLGTAPPAHARTVTLEQKLTALHTFTRPAKASATKWRAAWRNRAAWAEYGFDWSSDLCSASPDQPLGFDFRLACRRHDFGYRNYKALKRFPAHKARLDRAFYADMKRVCTPYTRLDKATCRGLAWAYYQAVRRFGHVNVTRQDIEKIRRAAARFYEHAED